MSELQVDMKEWTDIRRIDAFYQLLRGADHSLIQCDFSGTSFIDSVVFQLLLSMKRSFSSTTTTIKRQVSFVNVPDCIRQDAMMLGMNELFQSSSR